MIDINITEKIASHGWDDNVSRDLIFDIENTIWKYTNEAKMILKELKEINTEDIEKCLEKANQYFEKREHNLWT